MADLIIKKGKYWYANCTYMKVLLRASLKTGDQQIATERLAELFMLVRQEKYQHYKIKFVDLVAKYNPTVDRKNKLRNLKIHLLPAFEGKRLHEIDIQTWAEKIAANYKEATALAILRPARELGFEIDYKNINFIPGKQFSSAQIPDKDLVFAVFDRLKKSARSKKYYPIARAASFSAMPLSDLLHLPRKSVVFTGPDAGITYTRRKTRHKNKPPPVCSHVRCTS